VRQMFAACHGWAYVHASREVKILKFFAGNLREPTDISRIYHTPEPSTITSNSCGFGILGCVSA
jgi:hypothetical protein